MEAAVESFSKFIQKIFAAQDALLEYIQTPVQPVGQDRPVARFAEGNMDFDVVLLPDAIQTPYSLFDQFRIQREIKEHQMTAKLKIPAFAADFGANQEPGTVFFGKPSGISVPLNEG